MLVPAAASLDTATGGIRALYVSLNSPVVTAEGLPVGPASAAIALHEGGRATLVIRSSRTRAVALLCADPAPTGGLGAAEAFAHAEGLGFLFDEDQPLGGDADRRGWPAWLAEIFASWIEIEIEAARQGEPGASLSKFRWALPAAAELGGRP